MFQRIKKFLYFFVAGYFRFFASIRLKIWMPRVIVITGSSGKTTLLHLVESQLGDKAKYSHEANSSFGVPFDILGLHRKNLLIAEWPKLFVLAPLRIFSKLPNENIYVVEADCDRPKEGDFLSKLLQPEVTLWTNVSKTHSMNFDKFVDKGAFDKIEDAIAYEFGFFAERTKSLVIVNEDNSFEMKQLYRVTAKVNKISSRKTLRNYRVNLYKTEFVFDNEKFRFDYLLPEEVGSLILMSKAIVDYLGFEFDNNFHGLILPPGRNSFFEGFKNITIVDSTYNANLNSMCAVINMFGKIEAYKKWVVLGDMLEQGKIEKEEHQKLAELILKYNFQKIILMGPRVSKFTKPILVGKDKEVVSFLGPKEVLDYLMRNIKGGEVILFKGARFLEGVVEHLLKNKEDANKLARREKVWQIRRKKWGL